MKKNSQAFVNQLVVCLLVTICFGGSLGVATVWMRHKISDTANTNRQLVAQIEAIERRISEKDTDVESELRAPSLRQLNDKWHLGLVMISDVPVHHVTDDVAARLAERSSRGARAFLTDGPALINFKFAPR
jgi:hypothetical protein